MDKIQSNTGYNLLSSQNGEIKQNTFKQVPYPAQSVPQKTLRDEFVSQHKKNGLFERLYNGIKNLTHLGTGSKKAQAAIDKAEKGEISEEQARATITKYRNSQANSAQILGDAASIGASMGTFFGVRTLLKKLSARNAVNNNSVLKDIFGESGNLANKMADGLKSNKKLAIISAITAAFMGGFVKDTLLRINGIGSKEFKTDKKDFNNLATEYDRSAYKFEKKHNKRMRRNSHFRNFVSGAINGLMMPVTMVGGAIVGVPLYLAGNSLNRYFIGNNNESNKSFNSYFENLSNDGVAHAALAVGMAVPLVKKGKWSNVFDKNLEKAVAKLKDAALKPAFEENRTAYNELNDLLMNSREVENIIWSSESIEKQIKKLTDENIFAVKFKQISNDGSALCKALKEDCPPSRTFEEAKKLIEKNFGEEYEIKQLLGVGTVAETYLAKGKDGKDVCIKILKDGITKEKIQADKVKFDKLIENSVEDIEKQKYLKRNLDDLYKGISEEINLENEKIAAENLVNYTSVAKVVKPIKVVNNMYVMEKADGISLESLINLNTATEFKKAIEKNVPIKTLIGDLEEEDAIRKMLTKDGRYVEKEEAIEILQKYIDKVQSRTPQYGDIKLSKNDIKALIEEYQQVLIEQFNKVDKKGKVLHADIHPGNIFIDINALKNRKGGSLRSTATMLTGKRSNNQIFTLIDTGNTIKMDQAQALRSINLSSYIKRANVNDITEYVLDGAILPKGMTKEQATTIISDKLKQVFFDTSTSCEKITNESLINLTTNIMREHGIIPADTALNLNKARTSANNSLAGLYDSMGRLYASDILSECFSSGADPMTVARKLMGTLTEAAKDVLVLKRKNTAMQAAQEKFNLKNMTADLRKKYKHNPNNLATNSEDLLTYELKQSIRKGLPEDIGEML